MICVSSGWGLLMLKELARLHDAITAASFTAPPRAWRSSPVLSLTKWSPDISSVRRRHGLTICHPIALCPMIFLAIPAMTQQRAHIAVAYLVEGLSGASRHRAGLAVAVVAMLVCLLAAWITGAETWRQYARGVETISANPISKWWVSIFIPYGLLSSALYFMRQCFSGAGALPVPLEGMPQ